MITSVAWLWPGPGQQPCWPCCQLPSSRRWCWQWTDGTYVVWSSDIFRWGLVCKQLAASQFTNGWKIVIECVGPLIVVSWLIVRPIGWVWGHVCSQYSPYLLLRDTARRGHLSPKVVQVCDCDSQSVANTRHASYCVYNPPGQCVHTV